LRTKQKYSLENLLMQAISVFNIKSEELLKLLSFTFRYSR